MGLVTMLNPLITTGIAELVAQTGETRLVADCKLKPVKFVGHVKIMFAPEEVVMLTLGWTGTAGVERVYAKPPASC